MSRSRSLTWLAVLAACVTVALLIAALLTDTSGLQKVRDSASEPVLNTDTTQIDFNTSSGPKPLPEQVEKRFAELAEDPALGKLAGVVIDIPTGEIIWSQRGNEPMIPASTLKIPSAFSILGALDAGHRVWTRAGTAPQIAGKTAAQAATTLVISAGGDVTLSTEEKSVVYPGAPTVADLIEQVKKSGFAAEHIVVDISAFSGDPLAKGWDPADIGGGYIAAMDATMLDGGRIDASKTSSPRSSQPALEVGKAVAQGLGISPDKVSIVRTSTPIDTELAAVSSAPLVQRVRTMLEQSDNVLAEALCREAVLYGEQAPATASFADSIARVKSVFESEKIDTTGLVQHDCSGLSSLNRITVTQLASVIRAADKADKSAAQRRLMSFVPVAAVSGTLDGRYEDQAAAGAGYVRAKTGTLTGASAIAGDVLTADNRPLAFAFISNDSNAISARPALDALAAQLRLCGCSE